MVSEALNPKENGGAFFPPPLSSDRFQGGSSVLSEKENSVRDSDIDHGLVVVPCGNPLKGDGFLGSLHLGYELKRGGQGNTAVIIGVKKINRFV